MIEIKDTLFLMISFAALIVSILSFDHGKRK